MSNLKDLSPEFKPKPPDHDVILFRNGSKESEQAQEVLENLGLRVQTWNTPEDFIPEEGMTIPQIHTPEGPYYTIDRIREWINLVQSQLP